MTELILPISNDGKHTAGKQESAERMQVMVHLQAEVLTPTLARHRANVWLAKNAGHLLIVKNPELVLGEALQWRFEVFLSVPQLEQPGTVRQNQIGHIRLDALTEEVVEPVYIRNALTLSEDTRRYEL